MDFFMFAFELLPLPSSVACLGHVDAFHFSESIRHCYEHPFLMSLDAVFFFNVSYKIWITLTLVSSLSASFNRFFAVSHFKSDSLYAYIDTIVPCAPRHNTNFLDKTLKKQRNLFECQTEVVFQFSVLILFFSTVCCCCFCLFRCELKELFVTVEKWKLSSLCTFNRLWQLFIKCLWIQFIDICNT